MHAACSLAASNNFGCNFPRFGAWGGRLLTAVGRGLQMALDAAEPLRCRWERLHEEPEQGHGAAVPLSGELLGL